MLESEGTAIIEKKETRCLCQLPMAILDKILSYLSLLDYISFRSVCKCWRSAFLNFPLPLPSANEARKQQLPLFLLLSAKKKRDGLMNSSVRRPLLHTTGKLGDLSTRRIYTADIPELCGTQILLSRYGWLLLFSSSSSGLWTDDQPDQSSLFFFNPFSGAKIALPFLEVPGLLRPVFDISEPPTSPACMLFAISFHNSYILEINFCRRGESAWKTQYIALQFDPMSRGLGPVVNTVFVNGIWYCFHQSGDFSTFDAVKCSWKCLGRPQGMDQFISEMKNMSFVVKRGDQVFLRVYLSYWLEIELTDPLKIVSEEDYNKCSDGGLEQILVTDLKRAVVELKNKELVMDSFSADAWCGECDSDGLITFRWHHLGKYVDNNNYYYLRGGGDIPAGDKRFCYHDSGKDPYCDQVCPAHIMWIEPTWVNPSEDLSWTTSS